MKIIERLRELLGKCKFGATKVERTDGDMEVGCPDRFDVIAENGDAIAAMYLREQSRCEDGAALLSESCNALAALLAVVEAAVWLREVQQQRDYDESENAAAGQTYSVGDVNIATAQLDAALRAMEGGA